MFLVLNRSKNLYKQINNIDLGSNLAKITNKNAPFLMSSSWSDLRRRVARIGASLDVVVRSDPEVCGLSGSGYQLTLHHSGYGDCTVGDLSLIDCPNELVLVEFERWMRSSKRFLLS